jgi:hypothetical protein
MRYDQYLAQGWPIGTGVVEGACRHVVKDRMEQSGMRWTEAGALAVLADWQTIGVAYGMVLVLLAAAMVLSIPAQWSK